MKVRNLPGAFGLGHARRPSSFSYRPLGMELSPVLGQAQESQTGLVTETPTKSIISTLVGVAALAASSSLPSPFGLVATVGGIGFLGFGLVGLYESFNGSQEPVFEKRSPPPGQTIQDVIRLNGSIAKPGKGSRAEITNTWKALFGNASSTYAIELLVTNSGNKAVTPIIEFHTIEHTRPLWLVGGKPQKSEYRSTYINRKINPGATEIVKGFQPTSGDLYPTDATGELVVRNADGDPGNTIASVSFEIGTRP